MGYQPLEDLLPRANHSIYRLVRMASMRALELADGLGKLIEIDSSTKTATIALEEILAGKVMLKEIVPDLPKKPKKQPKTESPEEQKQGASA